MNTVRPAEETWVDQSEDGVTNTPEDGTSLQLLVPRWWWW